MGIFSGLSNYIVPAANSLAGYNAGAESEKDKTLKNALTMYQMKRQQEQDALKKSLDQSMIAKNTAMASGNLVYRQGPDGEWYALPGRMSGLPNAGEATKPDAAPAPAMPPVAAPIPSQGDVDLGASPPQGGPTPVPQGGPTSAAPKANVLGLPTGVKGPVKATRVDPNSAEGIAAAAQRARNAAAAQAAAHNSPASIAADSTRAANTAKTQTAFGPQPQTAVVTTDPVTQQQKVSGFNTRTAKVTDTGAEAKAAGGLGGGQSLAPEDRLKMLNQAKLDNETMKQFEAKVLAGQANVGMGSGVAGSLAGGHGTGVLPGVLAAVGNTATGAINPEYQKYLTAQRSYGRIMGNLQSKRYSDNQAEIERSISGLGANDLPSTIQYKQALRDASLADPVIMPQGGGRGGGGAPAVAAPKGATTTPATPGTHEVTIGGRTYRVPD